MKLRTLQWPSRTIDGRDHPNDGRVRPNEATACNEQFTAPQFAFQPLNDECPNEKKKRIASTPNPIQKEIVVADSLTPSSKPSEFDTKEAVEISET